MDIPPELLQHVLSYCSKEDLISLACCNRRHYLIVKHLIWKQVHVEYPDCGTLGGKVQHFHNLRHCEVLILYWTPRNLQDPVHHPSQVDALSTEKLCSFVFNYSKFLASFDTGKMRTLSLTGVDIESFIHNTLTVFKLLKKLVLRSVKITDWLCLMHLKHLKMLAISQCFMTNETIEKLLLVHQLEELNLNRCWGITKDCLIPISEVRTLNKLTISDLFESAAESQEHALDLELLSALENLELLSLQNIPIKPDLRMVNLWNSLSKLNKLDLCSLRLEDDDLKEIQLLTLLTSLKLRGSNEGRLTSKCFVYINRLNSLSNFSFSTDLCAREHEDDMKQNLLLLNKMPTLNMITMEERGRHSHERFLAILCSDFKWGLKMPALFYFQKYREYILFRCKRII